LAGIPNTATGLLNSLFSQGSGTPGQPGYVPAGLLPTIGQYFGNANSAASQVAANTDMENVNMGILDPSAGATTSGVLEGQSTNLADMGLDWG
jgi:hypothetical protein